MSPHFARLLEEYRRERAGLLEAYPELAEDDATLADTLDGETDLSDALAGLFRSSREDEASAAALYTIITQMIERAKRLDRRAQAKRAVILRLMQAAGLKRIERPDFTLSRSASPAPLIISPDAVLPDELCRIRTTREPDRTAIREALRAGQKIPGVALGNGGERLTARVS